MRAMRMLAVTVALVVGCACSGYARHGSVSTASPTPRSYGGSSLVPSLNAIPTPGKTTGTITVTVLDPKRHPVVGASLSFKGAQRLTATTDARGIAAARVRPGRYVVAVKPCGPTAITDTFGDASVSVGAGQVATGTLTDIKWRRRFHPTSSVTFSQQPPWSVGRTVTVGARVEDACTFALARSVPLPGYAWRLSKNFVRATTPVMRSGSSGYVRISIRCGARGDGSIVIYDSATNDTLNVLDAGSGPPEGRHWCE